MRLRGAWRCGWCGRQGSGWRRYSAHRLREHPGLASLALCAVCGGGGITAHVEGCSELASLSASGRLRRRRRLAGCCTDCGVPVPSGAWRCPPHQLRQRGYR